jgi:hypothetical protein
MVPGVARSRNQLDLNSSWNSSACGRQRAVVHETPEVLDETAAVIDEERTSFRRQGLPGRLEAGA